MKSLQILLAALLLVVTACGGSDTGSGDDGGSDDGGGSSATSSTTAPSDNDDGGSSQSGDDGGETPQTTIGEAGSYTVNGEEFAVTTLNRCIPFSDEPGNYDLQALAQGTGTKLNLTLAGGLLEVSVDGGGIRERFGSIAFGDDPVVNANEIAGDRWTGSATVGDSTGGEATVDITWDVMIPAEARDCGL